MRTNIQTYMTKVRVGFAILRGKMDGAYGLQVCGENYIKIIDVIFKFFVDKMLKMD